MFSFEKEIAASLEYLGSAAAHKSLETNFYWPKWNSPWWHMLLLHELGETKKIPAVAVHKFIEVLNRFPLKIFPIHPADLPDGIDPYDTFCHCQLGNHYRVLSAWGIDVDKELPWMRPWFLRYQMADGGFNCDSDAYLVKGECPSSMVGSIAALEAILEHTPRAWTEAEVSFLDKGAQFLMERKLIHGSQTQHNFEEQEQAQNWSKLCFPRFYLYDVLRGLHVLLNWAERREKHVPAECIEDAVAQIQAHCVDGKPTKRRTSFDNVTTRLQSTSGEWMNRQPATLFPLLELVSETGTDIDPLTRQWEAVKDKLSRRAELRL